MEEPTQYTYEDFAEGTAPYEYIYGFEKDKFTQTREIEKLSRIATKVGYRAFKRSYKDYVAKTKTLSGEKVYADSVTQFEDQPLELNCGQWRADDMGISREGPYGEIWACNHPILPIERLVNIDTQEEKMKLAYRKGRQWRHIIADKKTLASNRSIIDLAARGVAVTSENGKNLVQYLYDVESLNYDTIPEKNSVSRLGWIDGQGFSPYVENLIFDGQENFRSFFASVSRQGNYEEWLTLVRSIRQGDSIPARIVLAASFASAIVSKADALSFFVHLWGSESGTGKTVALMLAASVWANPEMGQYIHTFNGTSVSLELSAGFVNAMPLILDEFQMLKNKKDFEQVVYMLAEGVGRGRGSKTGGVQRIQTWRNCILTSGEMPITNFVTGAGAFNRIIEIECTEKLFENPVESVLPTVRKNYGYAGKCFVDHLKEPENVALAKRIYNAFSKEIVESDATDKQAMAGAIILTADALATEWIFQDAKALTIKEINPYLQTKSEVDTNGRAYNYIVECIAANAKRFSVEDNNGEIWGVLNEEKATIIRKIFDRICEDGGFSSRAVLSWLLRQGLVEPSIDSKSGKPIATKNCRIGGACIRCVVIKMPENNNYEEIENDNLPFG